VWPRSNGSLSLVRQVARDFVRNSDGTLMPKVREELERFAKL
jgi:hypothetical protein